MADDNEILTDIEIEIEASLHDIETTLSEFHMINVEGEPEGKNPIEASLTDVKKEVKKGKDDSPDYVKTIGLVSDLLKTVASSVKIFTNPKSNEYQIASGAFLMASSFVKVLGVIPGASLVTGPISAVLKLVGSILGKFGTKKETNYYSMVEQIVRDANNFQSTKETWKSLMGAIGTMGPMHTDLVFILSQTWEDMDIIRFNSNPIGLNDISALASSNLSSAYEDMLLNLPKENKANWANTAETFFYINKVVAFKVLVLLEGIAYYQLIGNGPIIKSDATAKTLNNSLEAFMDQSLVNSKFYFAEPGIVTSVIAHHIYRMPPDKFWFISRVFCNLYNACSLPSALLLEEYFFSNQAGQGQFVCSCDANHDHKPEDDNGRCVRLATLFDRRGPSAGIKDPDIERRSMTIPGDILTDDQMMYMLLTAVPPKPWMAPERYHVTDIRNKDMRRSHFALWGEKFGMDAPDLPYFSWTLMAKKCTKERLQT